MTKYVLTLVTFCVVLWAWLIHHQRQFPRYEWYKPFRRRLKALVDEYCKVSKNLQSVETLISKAELSKESHWLQTVGGIANENIKVGDDKY